MDIIKRLINNNRSNESFSPIGIVVHETATPGATAEREQQYFDSGYRGAAAHLFIDWESAIQCVPFEEVAWHAGPTANQLFLGIELCRPQEHDEEKFLSVWNNAIELFGDIFVSVLKCNILSKDTLMSHNEVSNKWHETDHDDPDSYFEEYGKSVDEFRNAVQSKIDEIVMKGSVKKVKNIVVHSGGADERAADYLGDYLYCPVVHKDNFKDTSIAENIYVVGGTWKPTPQSILISGSDRFETIIAVLKFMGKI